MLHHPRALRHQSRVPAEIPERPLIPSPGQKGIKPPGALGQERAYIRAIEKRFLSLREGGWFVSPRDFALLIDWQQRGVPAALVISTIERLFDQVEAVPSARKIRSIAYCRHAIEEAWEERRAALLGPAMAGGASRGGFTAEEVAAHLLRCVSLVEIAAGRLGGNAASGLAALAEVLRGLHESLLAGGHEPWPVMEEVLAGLEARSVDLAREAIPADALARLEQETAEQIGALAGRMSAKMRQATLRRAVDAAIRARCGLPRFSLFSMHP